MPTSTPRPLRLTLETPVALPDDGGGQTLTWVALGAHYAEISPATGAEPYSGSAQAQRVTHRILVRAHPAAARPRPDQRFRRGDRVYDVKAVFDRDGQGRRLTCLCEERAFAAEDESLTS